MNLTNCKRCGRTLVIGPKTTNKRFCSTKCYALWWNEQNFKGATQADRIRKQLGEAPNFELSDLQSVWLACCVDGEGSVGIWRQRSNDRLGYRYHAVVTVNNTHREFLEQAQKLMDGWYFLHEQPRRPQHKPVWTVRVKPRAVAPLLEQIKSHLIIKRKQADLVLEYCRAVAASPVHNRAMQPTFERLYQKCKALNKRGTK